MGYDASVAFLRDASSSAQARWSEASFAGDETVMDAFATELGARGTVLSLHSDDDPTARILSLLGSAVHDDSCATVVLEHAAKLVSKGAACDDQAVEGGWLRSFGTSMDTLLRISFRTGQADNELVFSAILPFQPSQDRASIAAVMRRHVPMLHLYFGLWQRHRREVRRSHGIGSALDAMDPGILLIDRHGDLGFVNATATAMLDEGTILRRRGRTLSAARLADTMKVQAALAAAISANLEQADATQHPRDAVVLQLTCGRETRILAAVPAEQVAWGGDATAAMLLVINPVGETDRYVAPVCKLYGLSGIETRLACELVAGRSLQEASDLIRIKEQTARSYLKQIFQKTHVRRQADLVRLLLSSLVRTHVGIKLNVI